MSASDSTTPSRSGKPQKPCKPYPEFPLTAHPAGQWCKKIRGKIHYFGPWSDPDGALNKYLAEKDDLHAGRSPRPAPAAATLKDVVNAFLNAKQDAVNAGELSPQTWRAYRFGCDNLIAVLGKGRLVADLEPADFARVRNAMAKKYSPLALALRIQCIRSVFKFAFDAGITDRPARFGPHFQKPSKKTQRLHKAAQGKKLFTAEDIRRMIDTAGPVLKGMIFLGVNAGFGNADCGNLPEVAVDLDRGIVDFPRPKTGIPRRCVLWPETVAALREALAARPEPKSPELAGRLFLTRRGESWAKNRPNCPVGKEVGRLLHRLGINGRKGLGFYTLRHTFRTVADEAKDQPAADFIMGHEVPHMSSVYRETISDTRLKAVTDHVRAWLFPEKGTADERQPATGVPPQQQRPVE
jgi:integrase